MHLAMRRHKSIAKVAMTQAGGSVVLDVAEWLREYSQSVELGSYAGQLGTGHGVK